MFCFSDFLYLAAINEYYFSFLQSIGYTIEKTEIIKHLSQVNPPFIKTNRSRHISMQ